MSLSDIINVSITTTAKGISQAGFGTPLIASYFAGVGDLVTEYEDLAGLVTAGFTVNDPTYKAAAAVLAQDPEVESFKVGRRESVPTQIVDITPVSSFGTGFIHTIDVVSPDGTATAVTYTQIALDAVADIVAGLQTPLDAITDVTAVDNTTKVTMTVDNPGEIFAYSGLTKSLHMENVTADPGIATDLAAMQLEDPDWYGLAIDSNSAAEIEAAQVYIETLEKIALYNTSDWGAKDSGTSDDIMTDMQTAGYDRCGMMYSADDDGYAGAAWAGRMLPTAPGSATWAFKDLVGVTIDVLNVNEENAIEGKGGNYFTAIKSRRLTFDGGTPGGSFLDIVRGKDWLQARLEERFVQLVANNPKIPYTDAGADMARNEIDAQLKEGIDAGYIAADPAPTITVPAVASQSAADRAARYFPGITFNATLQGAIHKFAVSGTLSV